MGAKAALSSGEQYGTRPTGRQPNHSLDSFTGTGAVVTSCIFHPAAGVLSVVKWPVMKNNRRVSG